MKFEAINRILSKGFGNRVLIGIVSGFFDGVTPERCYEYIKNDLQLGYWASDSDWQKAKRIAKKAKGAIGELTTEKIIFELRKHNSDLLGVIINTPGGMDWLDNQVTELKKKLGFE